MGYNQNGFKEIELEWVLLQAGKESDVGFFVPYHNAFTSAGAHEGKQYAFLEKGFFEKFYTFQEKLLETTGLVPVIWFASATPGFRRMLQIEYEAQVPGQQVMPVNSPHSNHLSGMALDCLYAPQDHVPYIVEGLQSGNRETLFRKIQDAKAEPPTWPDSLLVDQVLISPRRRRDILGSARNCGLEINDAHQWHIQKAGANPKIVVPDYPTPADMVRKRTGDIIKVRALELA
ncbi:MAG: hypothetical protein ABTQ34_02815 [Bdellovibrionales bacterium]